MSILTAYIVGMLIGYAICVIGFLFYAIYPYVMKLVELAFDFIGGKK